MKINNWPLKYENCKYGVKVRKTLDKHKFKMQNDHYFNVIAYFHNNIRSEDAFHNLAFDVILITRTN